MKADELRKQVVDRLVSMMAEGNRPWHRGWNAAGMGTPASVATGKAYRGGNAVWLDLISTAAGYDSRWWGTFESWKARNCMVTKGSKCQYIFYFGVNRKKETDTDGKEVERAWRVARCFAVFHADQVGELVDGAKLPYQVVERNPDNYAISYEKFDEMIARSGADIRHGGDQPAYYPAGDYIMMTKRGHFDSAEEYYGTLAHELCHWAERRVNPAKGKGRLAADDYAMGELVAEIGSAYLLRELGIDVVKCEYMDQNKAAYLAGWSKAIKDNPHAIFQAASMAGKVVDYLIGREEGAELSPAMATA